MTKKQKLRNAVLLSLALSTAACGSVWAKQINIGPIFAYGELGSVIYDGSYNAGFPWNPEWKHADVTINSENWFSDEFNGFIGGIGAKGLIADHGFIWPDWEAEDAEIIIQNVKNLTVNADNRGDGWNNNDVVGIIAEGSDGDRYHVQDATGTVKVTVDEALTINAQSFNEKDSYGILASENGIIDVDAGSVLVNTESEAGDATGIAGDVEIQAANDAVIIARAHKGSAVAIKGFKNINAGGNVIAMAESKHGDAWGINGNGKTITAGKDILVGAGSTDGNVYGIKGDVALNAGGKILVTAETEKGNAVGLHDGASMNAKTGIYINAVSTDGKALGIIGGADLDTENGNIGVYAASEKGDVTGISGTADLQAKNGSNLIYAETVGGTAAGISGNAVLKAGADNSVYATAGGDAFGINGTADMTAEQGDNTVAAVSESGKAYGITGGAELEAERGSNFVAAEGAKEAVALKSYAEMHAGYGNTVLAASKDGYAAGIAGGADITTAHGNNIIQAISENGEAYGIDADAESSNLISFDGSNIVYGSTAGIKAVNGSNIDMAGEMNIISGGTAGALLDDSALRTWGDTGIIGAERGLKLTNGSTAQLSGDMHNIQAYGMDSVALEANDSTVTIDGAVWAIGGQNAVSAENSTVTVNGSDENAFIADVMDKDSAAVEAVNSTVDVDGASYVMGGQYGVKASEGSNVSFISHSGDNYFISAGSRDDEDFEHTDGEFSNAVSVGGGTEFTAEGRNNFLQAGDIQNGKINGYQYFYGDETAVSAVGSADKIADATLTAADSNTLLGAVYAQNGSVSLTAEKGDNVVLSATHGRTSGGADNDEHLVSALYAAAGADISLTAEDGVNRIYSHFDFVEGHDDDREITVWAEDGGQVSLNGAVEIVASNYGNYTVDADGNPVKGNALGIAVSAGSRNVTEVNPEAGQDSTVNINYTSEEHDSLILGDVVAGQGGIVNIGYDKVMPVLGDDIDAGFTKGGKLQIVGNLLSANGGQVNVDFAKGSYWEGRADDYGDADLDGHQGFFNPAFSDKITSGGSTNVKMEDGYWNVTGQSWLTDFNANNTIIDMISYEDNGTHAVSIRNMTGDNNTFIMSLNHENHATSDMLYIVGGDASVDVQVVGTIDGLENVSAGNALRFATVGDGISLINHDDRGSYITGADGGIFNTRLYVEAHEYDANDKDNDGYNGSGLTEEKPGSDNLEDFFNGEEEQPAEGIALLDEKAAADNPDNWEIVGYEGDGLSEAGKTILSLSKVNYSNAVYMDRFNKRMGEARFIDGDEGVWVRLRHDRIGKTDAFRSQNTMYEIGYDVKQVKDDGEHRIGFAIDYMDGQSEFTGVNGRGDISRKGLWAYDSWIGDKGHYRDIVAKWGHLSNDFEFNTSYANDVNADFSNNVYSISAEYGKKNDLGGNWYFEPQMQLQYAHVTDADYNTSMNDKDQTQLHNDAFDSLIARAGFRLGKDVSNVSTLYFKGDVLHEFMGDQDIYAKDGTTKGQWTNVGYENDGTWYDLGFGFATKVNKASYAYMDFERSFGHDNDETYQINAGMQWSF